MFHLGLFCMLGNEQGTFVNVLCEKNAVVEITRTTFDIKKYGEFIPVNINPNTKKTLLELLQGGEKQLGQQYFKYDGFSKTGNCQGYVRGLLQGSNLYTPEIDKFVYQPLDKIVEKLPSFTSKIAKFTTDLGGIADRLMGG